MITIETQFKVLEAIKKDGSYNSKGHTWRSLDQIRKSTGLGLRDVIMILGLCANLLVFKISEKFPGVLVVKFKDENDGE